MRVLVTRPAGQAGEWVDGLRAAGLDAVALPLIGIEGPAHPAAVQAAWAGLTGFTMVMFVSPNAAAHFFALRPDGLAWPEQVLAASPGPGTTAALQRLGVPDRLIVQPAPDAPQFDSEALWQAIAHRPWDGARVLIVRGTSGRDWFAARLAEQGASVELLAAYQRCAPRLDPPAASVLAAALADPGQHLWFFSSSEAVGHLAVLAPDAPWARASALATHPRIADRARQQGFGRVVEARPSLAAVAACIQSFA